MMTPCRFALWTCLCLTLIGLSDTAAQQPAKTLTNSIGMELVHIPAGEFDIGTPDSAKYNPWPSEHPQYRVKITKPFYLGKFEITQGEYEKVMGKNPSRFAKTGAYQDKVRDLDTSRFPVDSVSWEDSQAFCAELSNLDAEKKAGRVYRLPTSAEWEYACRAGTTTLFYSGDTVSFKDANFGFSAGVGMFGVEISGLKPPGRTTKVGSYAPNPWGLYDMHGNVVEWCQDYFDPDYYKRKIKEDPQGPEKGNVFPPQARVVRGGSWWTRSNYNRSACRHPSGQVGGPGRIGFRVVFTVAATSSVGSASKAQDKPVPFAKEWKGSFPNQEDEPLLKEAVRHVANEKAWAKLWLAWRGKEELPKLDLAKQLVLAEAVRGAANDLHAQFSLSDKGDLRGGFLATKLAGPGFVYRIVVMDRAGIKTYNGVDIEKIYPSSRPRN